MLQAAILQPARSMRRVSPVLRFALRRVHETINIRRSACEISAHCVRRHRIKLPAHGCRGILVAAARGREACILLFCYNRLDYRVGHSVDGASGDTEPLAASAIQPAGTGPHAGGLRRLAGKEGCEIGLLAW